MRKFIAIVVAVAACGCLLTSCNEKPKSYRFVKVMNDGQEQVENITAQNDTDALKQYLSTMEKIILENIGKTDEQPFKAMFVISPDGDTLNTNNELLEAAMKGETGVTTIHPGAAPAGAAQPGAAQHGTKLVPLDKQQGPLKKMPAAPAK